MVKDHSDNEMKPAAATTWATLSGLLRVLSYYCQSMVPFKDYVKLNKWRTAIQKMPYYNCNTCIKGTNVYITPVFLAFEIKNDISNCGLVSHCHITVSQVPFKDYVKLNKWRTIAIHKTPYCSCNTCIKGKNVYITPVFLAFEIKNDISRCGFVSYYHITVRVGCHLKIMSR